MTLVFVYGTLKRGKVNHWYMEGQRYLGEGRTAPRYRLYLVATYPGLIVVTEGVSIEGEVWEVDEPGLLQLDALEGLEEGLYRRETIEMLPPWDGQKVLGYIYARPHTGFTDLGVRFE